MRPSLKSLRPVLIGCAVLLAVLVFTAPAKAQVSIPITGTGPLGQVFTGTFTLERFVREAGEILAVGNLSGTLRSATGTVLGTVTNLPIRLPLDLGRTTGTCDILHLELGPLDLDLLGLRIRLNRVVLDIDAEQGPGNLLGNLLCAVANLLNNPGNPLGGILSHLNRILGILG